MAWKQLEDLEKRVRQIMNLKKTWENETNDIFISESIEPWFKSHMCVPCMSWFTSFSSLRQSGKNVFHYKHVLLKKNEGPYLSHILIKRYIYILYTHIFITTCFYCDSYTLIPINPQNHPLWNPGLPCLRIQHVYVRPLEGRLRILESEPPKKTPQITV